MFLHALLFPLLFVAAFPPGILAGFMDDGCDPVVMSDESGSPQIGTYCLDQVCNIKSWTTLDLDWCLGNSNGILSFAGNNFSQSCNNLTIAGSAVHAKCSAGNANVVDTSVDLSKSPHRSLGLPLRL